MRRSTVSSVLITILLFSCSVETDSRIPEIKNGSIALTLDMHDAPAEVKSITGTLSRNTTNQVFDFIIDEANQKANAVVNQLQPGFYQLRVDAKDENNLAIYSGSSAVMIEAGKISTVNLVLDKTSGSLVINIEWGDNGASSPIRARMVHLNAMNGYLDDSYFDVCANLDMGLKSVKINNRSTVKYPNRPPYYDGVFWAPKPNEVYPSYSKKPASHINPDTGQLEFIEDYFREWWYWGYGQTPLRNSESFSVKFEFDGGCQINLDYVMPDTMAVQIGTLDQPLQTNTFVSVQPLSVNDLDSVIIYHEIFSDYGIYKEDTLFFKLVDGAALTEDIQWSNLAAYLAEQSLDSVNTIYHEIYISTLSENYPYIASFYPQNLVSMTTRGDYHYSRFISFERSENGWVKKSEYFSGFGLFKGFPDPKLTNLPYAKHLKMRGK
ncbi:MAG: hypothetical protein KDD94_15075 [Calditrichaeota bacterium]|nr:hypothetical protein [Calditrichota bacterium]